MDIRFLWIILISICWLPRLFISYDQLALVLLTAFSTIITIQTWAYFLTVKQIKYPKNGRTE